MAEFGPGKREFIFCPHGEAVYFKKSWHHIAKFLRSYETRSHKPYETWSRKDVKFRLCPAHEMMKNKQYEGEVIIKNVPAKFRRELLNLIENMDERAMRKDVLDRVLGIKMAGNRLLTTTSENQLAQRIASKIGEVFKKQVAMKISRAKGGDIVRIEIDFNQFQK